MATMIHQASTPPNYDALSGVFTPMGDKIERLILDLISQQSLDIHRVTHRVKTDRSASTKVSADPERYQSYDDLHDLLGVRIITLLADDVRTVVNILRDEFDVDPNRSTDRSEELDPEQFGYLSSHLVVKLKSPREGLNEWAPYRDKYFEIQIRSILQHAWAEIEHDLGYKTPTAIPRQLKRRFARLAGLLEIADAEFDALSDQINEHVKETETAYKAGTVLPIDRDSIFTSLTSPGPLTKLDTLISEASGFPLVGHVSKGDASGTALELINQGYRTLAEVIEAIDEVKHPLVRFSSAWLRRPAIDSGGVIEELNRGIGLFYFRIHQQLQTEEGRAQLRSTHYGLHIDSEYEALLQLHAETFSG